MGLEYKIEDSHTDDRGVRHIDRITPIAYSVPMDERSRDIIKAFVRAKVIERAAKREEVCKLLFAIKARQRSLQGAQEALAAIIEDFGRARQKIYAALLAPDRYLVAPDVDRAITRAFRPLIPGCDSVLTVWGIPVEVDPTLPFGGWYLRAIPHSLNETRRFIVQEETH